VVKRLEQGSEYGMKILPGLSRLNAHCSVRLLKEETISWVEVKQGYNINKWA